MTRPIKEIEIDKDYFIQLNDGHFELKTKFPMSQSHPFLVKFKQKKN